MYRIKQIDKQYNLLSCGYGTYGCSMYGLGYIMSSMNKLNITESLCAQNDY